MCARVPWCGVPTTRAKMSKLLTPHSGYHWDTLSPHFFEGWYFRVGADFAFMYSIQDPQGKQPHSGGAVQILGPQEEYTYRSFPDVSQFWAAYSSLSLVHWGQKRAPLTPQILSPDTFNRYICTGYQITPTWHQGYLPDCSWYFRLQPRYTWGQPQGLPQATGDWLSYLPLFDPGWQVLMALGIATGWINWRGKTYSLTNCPIYAEKNWGKSFPQRWFWINGTQGDRELSVTAVGALREGLGIQQPVGIVGIHYQDRFYEFKYANAELSWEVQPWGLWIMAARNAEFRVSLRGNTSYPPTRVRVPTREGLVWQCWDTTRGHLQLELWDRRDRLIYRGEIENAGLEVGGEGWDKPWNV
jgi:tocopherol cyclase